ncbi:hypothetical protein ABH309_25195 [Chromobacterium piscinae]|uniref:LysR substrate-binding domain-containing protein n=1 Tax=Chromobacterium piscinae TaxID=686831 RepID=A0ABV0HCC0_9NEIS
MRSSCAASSRNWRCDDQAQRLHIDVYAATRRDDARPALLQALEKLSDGAP